MWWAGLVLDSFLPDPVVELVPERSVVIPPNSTDMKVILGLKHSGEGLKGLDELLLCLPWQGIDPNIARELILDN